MSDVFKKLMLEQSQTFCMVPWTHIHTTPTGVAAPCCIAESCATEDGVGNSRTQRLTELVNSPKMKQLRLDMLSGVKNPECLKCHNHEKQGVRSFRQMFNDEHKHHFDEAMGYTNPETGELTDFKMRYFDIRFSNICNFKCRTCGSGFSTQWEQEDLKSKVFYARQIPKNDNKEFLKDVIEQIDNIETAYFAGGEPLITDEHYIMLEEMIRRGRTDINLRYNTNLSNLKFKDKDLLSLWKHFKKRIDIYASIDHYGDRAEYIRHGTNWARVEENFHIAKKTPFLSVQMNTVLSVFNYLTIYEFYSYLIDKGLYDALDSVYTLYCMSTPEHLTAHILPPELKAIGKTKMRGTITLMRSKKFSKEKVNQLEVTIPWVSSQDTWEQQKNKFRDEIRRLDKLRGESFKQTFPEIANLILPDRKRLWPV